MLDDFCGVCLFTIFRQDLVNLGEGTFTYYISHIILLEEVSADNQFGEYALPLFDFLLVSVHEFNSLRPAVKNYSIHFLPFEYRLEVTHPLKIKPDYSYYFARLSHAAISEVQVILAKKKCIMVAGHRPISVKETSMN